jgi:hypothetical protein
MLDWKEWEDYPENPLIGPGLGGVVADPTLISPEESPDGRWHMFTSDSLLRINHHISRDGILWRKVRDLWWLAYTQYVFKDGAIYYIFYQRLLSPLCSVIAVRTSGDLWRWSREKVVLTPSLWWEGKIRRIVRNPCITRCGRSYFLYYSGGLVFIKQLGFSEPKFVGVAIAESPCGPFRKYPERILLPNNEISWRNLAAGGMRVYHLREKEIFVGFNNGIYIDRDGRVRSAISILTSSDGLRWKDEPYNPVIVPTQGWKRALVYQLDVKRLGEELRLYYNARDGWRFSRERIGLATLQLP